MSKVVLLTGVRSNIGTIIAKHLSSQGYIVYGTTRKNVSIHPESDDSIKLIKIDLNDKVAVEGMTKDIIQKEGKIDVLINNAAIGITGPMEEMDIEDIESIFKINYFGTVQVTQATIPYMRKAKSGLIINLSSIGGQIGLPFRSAFSASKFAIEGMSESLSIELKQFGINVCLVEPGSFKTNHNTNRKVALVSVYSPYKANFDATLAESEKDKETSDASELVGPTIEKIIQSSKPKFRYHVGAPKQKIFAFIKGLIPFRMFEKIVMKHYGIMTESKINKLPNDQIDNDDVQKEDQSTEKKSIFKM